MRTLAEKLRLPPGAVAILNASPGQHRALGSPATSQEGPFDFVLLFVRDTGELRRLGPDAVRAVKPQGLLWIAYPKGGRTRGATDLPASPWWHRRDVLGEYTGETGYRPVAQVAIDDDWTALRFRHGT